MWRFIFRLSALFLGSVCLPLCQENTIWLQQLYSRHGKCESHKCVLPFQDYFEYSQFLEFPHEFQAHLVNFYIEVRWNFHRHCTEGACVFNHVRLSETTWTIACLVPLSMGVPSQEYWKGCHFLLQEILQTQGSNPCHLCRTGQQVLYHQVTRQAHCT